MRRIAIIGGGAAGAAVVGELLRHSSELEIVWLVGRHAVPGRGVAYATNDRLHLLNVRAANMGLFADDPGGLVRYLQSRNLGARPGDFVPRAWFGDYVEETLNQLLAGRRPSVSVEILSEEAVALEQDQDTYSVRTDEGKNVVVDGAVLAVGALPPVPIAEVDPEAIDGGRYLPDPWQVARMDQAPQRVVILGSGLTAVDVILTAATNWPDAQIVALSRHGRLPAPHRAEPSAPYAQLGWLVDSLRAEPSARNWLRLIREAAGEDSVDWRSVVDSLRPVGVELWRSLDQPQRRRFLRHARWAWDIVRHRMPLQTADAIQSLRDEGRLKLVAGRIQRIEGRSPPALTYRSRDDGTIQTIAADLAIQATGLQTAVQRTPHRLLRQMLQTGLVQVDPQGLGIGADADGRVMRADGTFAHGLRAIGTLLRGVLWECTALPEIRMFAARLARELPTELRKTSLPKRHFAVASENGSQQLQC